MLGASSSVNTALRYMKRDVFGRAQVSSPSALNDIANKAYVDGGSVPYLSTWAAWASLSIIESKAYRVYSGNLGTDTGIAALSGLYDQAFLAEVHETYDAANQAFQRQVIYAEHPTLGKVTAERSRFQTAGVFGSWTAWALVAAPSGGAATITPFVAAPASTQWISTPGSSTAAAPGTPALNTLALAPIYLRRGVSLSEVGVKTWATASAGGIIRVGIWASDANDKPTGSPLITATIATDGGNGNMYQTFASTAVPAGLVFVGFVQQVASATMGLLEMGAPAHVATHGGWQLNLDGGAGGYVRPDAYNVTGVSGALGTLTGATFVPAQYIPRFSVKVA
jgi:hypothetical protein